MNRRTLLRRGSSTAVAAAALAAVSGLTSPAMAAATTTDGADPDAVIPDHHTPQPDPATTPLPNPPYPAGLSRAERRHLQTFDELDFVVYSNAQWTRMAESHARNIRVHLPDGTFTDGLDAHIAALQQQFVWAPDTHINQHPVRVAKNDLTAVTGVLRGTFSRPMPTPQGLVPPNGRTFAVNMATVGFWTRRGVMDEEWLFLDSGTLLHQLGLG